MASTYSSRLRLEQPGDGDYEDAGAPVFAAIMQRIDDAIAGTAAITMSNANYTLTANNGADDEARRGRIQVTGALTATRDVICPSVSKGYVVQNNTSGGHAIVFKTASGTGVSVANGASVAVWCDGTNVVLQNSAIGGGGSGAFVTLNGSETLTNKTLTHPVINGQVFAATGSAAAPAYTFNSDRDCGMFLPGGNTLAWATAGSERVRVDSVGRVGLGVTAPSSQLHLQSGSGNQQITLQDTGTSRMGYLAGGSDGSGGHFSLGIGNIGGSSSEILRGTANKVLHVGQPSSSSDWHIIKHPTQGTQGARILSVDSAASVTTAAFYYVAGEGASNNGTALRLGKNGATNRSINAGGSINSNGADYAEYHLRAPSCGEVKPGQVIGLDVNDEVTDRFDDAVAFGIISTEPGHVGGDNLSEDPRAVLVAYCGRVPVIWSGWEDPAPGQWVIPAGDKDGSIIPMPATIRGAGAIGRVASVKGGQVIVRVGFGG